MPVLIRKHFLGDGQEQGTVLNDEADCENEIVLSGLGLVVFEPRITPGHEDRPRV